MKNRLLASAALLMVASCHAPEEPAASAHQDLQTLEFEVGGMTCGTSLLPEEERAGLDIRTISHGQAVSIEEHLVPGKVTIFDYYADWCGPCHLLAPKLERLVKRYRGVALRKIDIVDWESDAAEQATRDFRLAGLPHVRVYGAYGSLLGSVAGNHVEQVEALLEGHAQR